jgi:C4-dicarboxylate-specific signal transduction histidine kinase
MAASTIAFEQPELLEQQLAELSATFVSLPADQVDQQIDWGLQLLVEALGIDRAAIAELSPEGRLEITHSWARPGTPGLIQGNLTASLPWFAERIQKGEILQFERLPEELPASAVAEREYARQAGIRSQLSIPFQVGDRVIGCLGLASLHQELRWSPRLVRSARLVGEVFANAVARKHAWYERQHLREQLAHTARVNAMGEVVASIAHEVNQPLFAIVSNARAAGMLLARDIPDLAEIGAALDDIVQDANRASAIIAGVRSFLQRKPAEHQPLDVNGVVETVRTLIGPELARRRLRLELDLSAKLPSVRGDPVQLQQVLVNLLINGAEAMESVDPAHRILEVRTAVNGDRIQIDVVDRGPGLDRDTRERLFDPFFTTKAQGLGMGLAICRSIVESHGGRIQPLEPGSPGTTMQVWLPAWRP